MLRLHHLDLQPSTKLGGLVGREGDPHGGPIPYQVQLAIRALGCLLGEEGRGVNATVFSQLVVEPEIIKHLPIVVVVATPIVHVQDPDEAVEFWQHEPWGPKGGVEPALGAIINRADIVILGNEKEV